MTDQRILDAVAELVVERGYARVTVDDVVERAGTNKPAFYRRFRNLADVVPRLLASRHGTDEDIDTGTIVDDLIEVQHRQRRLFTDPVFARGFIGWLADVAADPARGAPFLSGYLGPRRAYTQVILDRAVRRGEIAPDADPGWIADLLTGPLLMRVTLPGLPPLDDGLAARTVHAALDALGYTGDRSTIPKLAGP
ncbi:TetR/AcrR family transcriptional regulator [Microbacterium sp. 18062]|uniref:TetR/AcrR family transcriptional regulator n=1 Tax=Microbacterium sp. 18062 TaxID=2681410 RepID=UPI00135B137A|nr:TetR/AcrR family transcriptional regulator [Microbacterium sp. 18062]